MKKKIFIINVLLSMAVLFSILFQSIHAYDHHSEQIFTKITQQRPSKNKAEISNNHSISEKCFSCDFNFSSFTTTDFHLFPFYKNSAVKALTSFFFLQSSSFFKGCLFLLRAPPLF